MKAMIVSLESFQKGEVPAELVEYIKACGRPFIVLDESSKIKTNAPCKAEKKSKRTQAILRLNKMGDRCILTGTFMSKSPVNAYDQMNFLCDKFFPESIYAFAERYEIRVALKTHRGTRVRISPKDYDAVYKRLDKCKVHPSTLLGAKDAIKAFYGLSSEDCDHILAHKEYTPFKNLDELWARIGDNVLRAERKDMGDIPPKVYKTINVPLTSEQKKLYLQLQNQYCTDRVAVESPLDLYIRFQDVCNGYEPVAVDTHMNEKGKEVQDIELFPLKENPKIDMLMEVLEEIGDKQVVIWCSRTKLLYDACAKAREEGYTCGVYDGKVGTNQREKDYEAFRNKEIQILFMNQASGGYGLDGLKESDYAVYLCNSYSVEQRQQSEDRIYRGEITRSKYIIDITCKGTCEDRVTQALKIGKELIDSKNTPSEVFKLGE